MKVIKKQPSEDLTKFNDLWTILSKDDTKKLKEYYKKGRVPLEDLFDFFRFITNDLASCPNYTDLMWNIKQAAEGQVWKNVDNVASSDKINKHEHLKLRKKFKKYIASLKKEIPSRSWGSE